MANFQTNLSLDEYPCEHKPRIYPRGTSSSVEDSLQLTGRASLGCNPMGAVTKDIGRKDKDVQLLGDFRIEFDGMLE